jgi:hypothetical protein
MLVMIIFLAMSVFKRVIDEHVILTIDITNTEIISNLQSINNLIVVNSSNIRVLVNNVKICFVALTITFILFTIQLLYAASNIKSQLI